jgi:hypothetical protein
MNRRKLAIALLVGSLLAATPGSSDATAELAEADAAFARGDYALSEQLYGRAEPRAADPGRVTLGLAAAKYRLALATPTRAAVLLAEAESLYRCCLGADDPRRAAALVGLGNCLLHEAGNRDAAAAWSAAKQFAEAEQAPGADGLDGAPQHNLQRARLLARQIPTVMPDKPDKPPPGDNSEHDRKPPENGSQPQEMGDAGEGNRRGARPVQADAGQPANAGDDSRLPGKGELPPVPDRDGHPPLTQSEAREHLEQAARLIMEEARHHRNGSVRPAQTDVRDW